MNRGMHGLVSEQSVYNLNNRMIELEVIPACTGYGMGLIPYSPVDGGMLAGAVEKERSGRRGGEWVTNRLERDRAKIAAYEDLCHRIGHPPAQVALAWLLQQPAVTSPIVGPRTLAQLEDAVAATDIRLDAETLAALDRIFPGPGGAAPEAYAW
jgi:aryl-alcohol dehydrogenase-like predicted oxidoreductase